MDFNIECPINHLSLGQVSTGLLYEFFKQGLNPNIFNIGNVDLSVYNYPDVFKEWVKRNIQKAIKSVHEKLPTVTIWHINGAFKQLPSKKNVLWTAHECDTLTDVEKNICNLYDKTLVTSEWSQEIFQSNGVDATFCPNFFDSNAFYKKPIRKQQGVIDFLLCGKFEKRKLTKEIIAIWAAVFGNNQGYRLNCLIHNPFIPQDAQNTAIQALFRGNVPWNINFLPFQDKNSSVNDLLNVTDIDISGLSGSEGWNLPAFNAICLDKVAVVMNAHAHKSFANAENAILVEPGNKQEIYDDVFFIKGSDYNQGNMYMLNADATKEALLNSVKDLKFNKKGKELAQRFSVKNTANTILNNL